MTDGRTHGRTEAIAISPSFFLNINRNQYRTAETYDDTSIRKYCQNIDDRTHAIADATSCDK